MIALGVTDVTTAAEDGTGDREIGVLALGVTIDVTTVEDARRVFDGTGSGLLASDTTIGSVCAIVSGIEA